MQTRRAGGSHRAGAHATSRHRHLPPSPFWQHGGVFGGEA
jgi:hypothetical protein